MLLEQVLKFSLVLSVKIKILKSNTGFDTAHNIFEVSMKGR